YVDGLKCGFPSDGLSTVTYKWWGSSSEGRNDAKDRGESIEGKFQADTNGDDMKQEDGTAGDEFASVRPDSLVAVRKRVAEEGREADKLCLDRGFGSKELNRRDQALLSQVFKSPLPKDWVSSS
ncbi:PREDICTED: uncharacterized protein LOC104827393, partial [Tarenaya hassleriana]|uniref:uncharacterized protein LOC104827393 n=1 Tax=Tarenaya hassleriana TaxID=28532 RepID=UPI00053C53AB